MPRNSRLFALHCVEVLVLVVVSACSEPKCPAPYMKYGDLCRLCPPGEAKEQGKCVPIRDASAEAVTSADAMTGETDSEANAPEDSEEDADAPEDTDPSGGDAGQASDAEPDVDADDACSPSPCQHGGRCSPAAQGASCDCADTGYSGATCETDVDECASAHSCSNAAYPCAQTEAPGFTCQGQFADWPMPDAVGRSKVKPSYDTTSVANVVIDNVTGLAWQKSPPLEARSWEEAKTYCESLELGGSSDWRVPTKIELESIVDDTQESPSIDREAFPDIAGAVFFTASPIAGEAIGSLWLVDFSGGLTWPWAMSGFLGNVRCVRTVRKPRSFSAARYAFGTTAGRATVADTRTGLVWERDLYATQVDQSGAQQRCASLGAPWRVPTKKELLTLADPTIDIGTPPVFDLHAFPGTPATAHLWSSTGGGDRAWGLLPNGGTFVRSATASLHVRCVQ